MRLSLGLPCEFIDAEVKPGEKCGLEPASEAQRAGTPLRVVGLQLLRPDLGVAGTLEAIVLEEAGHAVGGRHRYDGRTIKRGGATASASVRCALMPSLMNRVNVQSEAISPTRSSRS